MWIVKHLYSKGVSYVLCKDARKSIVDEDHTRILSISDRLCNINFIEYPSCIYDLKTEERLLQQLI
jgi:hypothetical protein